jgi:hypothetical protein
MENMLVKDFFKFVWKKPSLSPGDALKEENKAIFSTKMESIYSRLESAEILNSNGKTADAMMILEALFHDTFNMVADYKKFHHAKSVNEIKTRIDSLPENLAIIFRDKNEILNISKLEITEENSEKCEEQISEIISKLEKFFRLTKRTEWHTPMDDVKTIWKVQISSIIGLIVLILGTVGYQKIRYPNLVDGVVNVYFMNDTLTTATEGNSKSAPFSEKNRGEWIDYTFSLDQPINLTSIRLDPINQRRIKFSISEMSILDIKGRILYSRDFVLNENFLIKDYASIGQLNELKAGKAKPGGFVEMVSTGSNPYFEIKTPKINNVSKIIVKMRIIEERYKFKD